MLRQAQCELVFQTSGRGLVEITEEIADFVRRQAMKTGQCTLHLRHTSASLLIQENADPDVRVDLEAYFSQLVVDGDRRFIHTTEGPDDMAAHIRTALTAVNFSVPIATGELALGTWQGIYLWEHRTHPHRRRVVVHVIGE